MRSIVVSFDAAELPAGKATADIPGLAIRISGADQILSDGLDVVYEILGGSREERQVIIGQLEQMFSAQFKPIQDRDHVWRANAVFHNLEALRPHPIFSTLLDTSPDAERAMLVLEAGQCIMRIDFEHGATAWAERFRAVMATANIVGTVREVRDLGRALEDWQPIPVARSTPARDLSRPDGPMRRTEAR